MFLKNQSTILPANIQKIFHVSKPPRRLSLPFSPFSGYLWLSLAISAFLASLHPSSLPAFLRFHPSVLPSILPSHLPSVPSFLTSHVRSKTCMEGRFSSLRYTSGKPEVHKGAGIELSQNDFKQLPSTVLQTPSATIPVISVQSRILFLLNNVVNLHQLNIQQWEISASQML